MEALGGAADSLDPLTLLMASGGDGGSSWQRSEMDGIAIRLQVSNGIPIQVHKLGGVLNFIVWILQRLVHVDYCCT